MGSEQGEERRGAQPRPLRWVGLADWPVTPLWRPGCGCAPAQVAWANSHWLRASGPCSQQGQCRPHPWEQLPVGQEACGWGPRWLCSRNHFLGPRAVARILMLKMRPQEACRAGTSRSGRWSGLTHSLQAPLCPPEPPTAACLPLQPPSDPQLRGPCSQTRAASPWSRLSVGLRATQAGPVAWQPHQTPLSRLGCFTGHVPRAGTSLQQRPSPSRWFTHETLDGPLPLQMDAVATSVPPACGHRVYTGDRFHVRMSEWAEGEREVARTSLTSHHLVRGGPVLGRRVGRAGPGGALGLEGGGA